MTETYRNANFHNRLRAVAPTRHPHQRCVRCETRSAEGRQIAEFVGTRDGGTCAGENGEREPPRRLSGQSEWQEGVRAPELAPGFTSGGRTGRCSLRFTSQAGERHGKRRAAPPVVRGWRRDPRSVHVRRRFSGRGCRGFSPCRRGCR